MVTGPARRVLGIDPGTALLGYSVVASRDGQLQLVTVGTLTTPADLPLHRRLQTLYRGLCQIITTHRPTEVAVETLFFNQNARSALAVGQARGVALLAAAEADLPVFEYTPLAVKHAVLNYGRGTKEQVQEMVRILLNLPSPPEPDDAADAVAVAICHHHHASAATIFGQVIGDDVSPRRRVAASAAGTRHQRKQQVSQL